MEETIRLIRASQKGDMTARETLVSQHMGLVHNVARRFLNRGCEWEDLIQIGSVGLLKAILHFDFRFDVRFSTYAVPMIQGEIQRFLRDGGMLRVSRSIKENEWKIHQAKERYEKETGREATLQDIVERTGLSIEEIVMAQEAGKSIASLSQSVYQSDGSEIPLGEKLADTEDYTEVVINQMVLSQLMETLSEKERNLIHLRYYDGKTQTEIATLLGVSQAQASRMEKRILAKMKSRFYE
ncbi:MAG: SigB/SigF/SigG family RNA polymerase sigma factor [Lachnospiraceae bacterium]